MAKNCGEWGRDKARERYQSGGPVFRPTPSGNSGPRIDIDETASPDTMTTPAGQSRRADGGAVPLPRRDPRKIATDKKGQINIGSGVGYKRGGKA